jgi:hypothetical protein
VAVGLGIHLSIHFFTTATADRSSAAMSWRLLPSANSSLARACRRRYSRLRQAFEQNRRLVLAISGYPPNQVPPVTHGRA